MKDNHIVREGIVSSVNVAEHTARVIFEDADGMVSAELPVLVSFAGQNKMYALPDVGESVVCLFLENNGQSGAAGFILGSRYHAQLTPAVQSQDITRIDFADNAFISYDRKEHEFRIDFADDAFISYTRNNHEFKIQFSDGASIVHRSNGNLLIQNKGDIIMDGRQIKLN